MVVGSTATFSNMPIFQGDRSETRTTFCLNLNRKLLFCFFEVWLSQNFLGMQYRVTQPKEGSCLAWSVSPVDRFKHVFSGDSAPGLWAVCSARLGLPAFSGGALTAALCRGLCVGSRLHSTLLPSPLFQSCGLGTHWNTRCYCIRYHSPFISHIFIGHYAYVFY